MMRRLLLAACLVTLAGCASRVPAPVAESSPPKRVEAAPRTTKPAAAAEKPATVKKTPPREDIEVRPIAAGGPVVARSLDGPPVAAAAGGGEAPVAAVSRPSTIVLPAPVASGNNEMLKREPKGGKLPYSEENLARLKGRDTAPALPVTEKPAVAPPAPTPAAASEVEWAWPALGKLLAGFSENSGEANKGVDIAGKLGDPVLAAAAGKVIYVGTMNKYGSLAIVLHSGGYSSVYAHNSKVLVKEGQLVTRGQKIAEIGDSDADQPKLHFEVRQQGKPVDPLKFLPSRG